MSGGHFDYIQYRINDAANEIEKIIALNNVEKRKEDLERWDYDEDGNVEELAKYYYCYPDEVIEKFKEAVVKLREACVYAQRIDWLLSGDDGEGTFMKRLEKDLEEVGKQGFATKEDYLDD